MITVDIKLPAGISGIGAAVSAALPEIAGAVKNDIQTIAGQNLKTSLIEYRQGLQIANYRVSASKLKSGGTFTFAVITLAGWLANAVEDGWEGGDMVPALLRGRSARNTKHGKRVAVVHFRQTKAGTSGKVGGVMGALEQKRGMNRQQAELVGKKISRAAKQLSANESGVGGHKRLSSKVAAMAGAMTMKGTAKGATSQYESFRTVSAAASGGKFLHPGIPARHFFAKAAKRVPGHVRMIIDDHVGGLT